MNVPNFITLARLFSVPVVVWLILDGNMLVAFWVFLIAALSDAADGIIAKQFDSETVFGAFLDPIADKLLIASVLLILIPSIQSTVITRPLVRSQSIPGIS